MESDSQQAEEIARKNLESQLKRLREEKPSAYLKYRDLLLKREHFLSEENGGTQVEVTATQKLNLIRQATDPAAITADLAKVERNWERAISRKGRLPIGGAQDD
jgi:hypothetical protein